MNLNSSGNHHSKNNCLYNNLTKETEQCRKLKIDLNLPASSIETEDSIPNYDNEARSRYAGSSVFLRPHNNDSDTKDSSFKDASMKKTSSSSSSIVKWKQQVEVPPNDGHMWRKYGQKEILNAKYPREYYRCTYRNTHGCAATKQVQRCSHDPSIFEITYRVKHTCPKIPTSSATESGYGLINFSSKNSGTSDPSFETRNSNSFELSNWPLNHC